MSETNGMSLHYLIDKDDFDAAGEASSKVKKTLTMLGVSPANIKRVTVAMYEAEINAFIHGGGGEAYIEIFTDKVIILIEDQGSGIEDLEMAMKEGYSTASDEVRMMGFGAGMGLPNIKKNADQLEIDTEQGKGTKVKMTFLLN